MKTLLHILLICCPLLIIAEEFLEKLNKFTDERRATVESEIETKRQQVAKVLQSHLQRETKAGNLKGALALQKSISELKPTPEICTPSIMAGPTPR